MPTHGPASQTMHALCSFACHVDPPTVNMALLSGTNGERYGTAGDLRFAEQDPGVRSTSNAASSLQHLSVVLVGILVPFTCQAQIDPYRRQLLQFGYNQPVKGHWPMAGYLFYLLNQPDFLRPDLTLRLAVAPTYLDSEFGFNHALGPHTDLALGLSGGGFADSYHEIRRGKYLIDESFIGTWWQRLDQPVSPL